MTRTRHPRSTILGRKAALWMATAALLLAACGPTADPLPPTRTPAPTFTPTPLGEPAAIDPNAVATAQAVQGEPVDAAAGGTGADTGTTVTGDTGGAAVQQPTSTSVFDVVVGQTPAPEQPADAPAAAQPAAPADQPTATPTTAPTATPAPTNPQVTLTQVVNIRGGPGTNYNVVGSGNAGQTFPVTGKNPAGDWWQITFNGQPAWIYAPLVTPQNTGAVAVAANIPPAPTLPPPPPATNTPVPPPAAPPPAEQPPAEQPPAEQPPAEQPPAEQPAPPAGDFPFILGTTERCDPNPGQTYFSGVVRDTANNPVNGVCVHIFFYEPRTTKCSGCDGVGDGNWGFSPFNGPAPAGTAVEIFVVQCPGGGLPMGGQSSGFGDLTPQSPKWTRTINDSEQCVGITFYKK